MNAREDFGAFVSEFQQRLDAATSLADLLAPNARLIGPAQMLDGVEAIEAWVTGRSADQLVRHTWNNLRVTLSDGEARATLRYIATAWHGDLSGAPRRMTLGDVTDNLTRSPQGGWLLAESRFTRIFTQNIA